MSHLAARRVSAVAAAVSVTLASIGIAYAQQEAPTASIGIVMGEVDRCVNGIESPAAEVAVGIDGGSASLARSDSNGQFVFGLPPGEYTVVVTAIDGTTGNRQYVPVEAGQALDIGIIDLGGGVGCGGNVDLGMPAPAQEPAQATATPVPETPALLPAPTPTPVPPVPADQQPAPPALPNPPASG